MMIKRDLYNATEAEKKAYAEKRAETVVIRYYNNGNSDDKRFVSSNEDKALLQDIIYGALLSIHKEENIQQAADTAEFILLMIEQRRNPNYKVAHINGYDSVYLPIKDWAYIK